MNLNKHMVIAGGSGFLGQALQTYFEQLDWRVSILTRTSHKSDNIIWDGKNLGDWCKQIEDCDVLINLCGKSVDCRYTESNRKEILSSRLQTTRLLNQALSQASHPPGLFINASSATCYVSSEDYPMTEKSGLTGHDFSMDVVRQWEEAFFDEQLESIRKVALRTSIVLGNGGGAFPRYKSIVKLGLGGKQGTGLQKVSWIHVHDFSRAIHHIIDNKHLKGPINITAPQPVTNDAFMSAFRKTMKPIIAVAQPRWLLELGAAILGTETELLLKSRNVIPHRLMQDSFVFRYPEVEDAIRTLYNKFNTLSTIEIPTRRSQIMT